MGCFWGLFSFKSAASLGLATAAILISCSARAAMDQQVRSTLEEIYPSLADAIHDLIAQPDTYPLLAEPLIQKLNVREELKGRREELIASAVVTSREQPAPQNQRELTGILNGRLDSPTQTVADVISARDRLIGRGLEFGIEEFGTDWFEAEKDYDELKQSCVNLMSSLLEISALGVRSARFFRLSPSGEWMRGGQLALAALIPGMVVQLAGWAAGVSDNPFLKIMTLIAMGFSVKFAAPSLANHPLTMWVPEVSPEVGQLPADRYLVLSVSRRIDALIQKNRVLQGVLRPRRIEGLVKAAQCIRALEQGLTLPAA